MFNFFSKEKEDVSLLIDIGNGSIAAALVLFKRGDVPKLLFNLRMPFSVADEPDSTKLITNLNSLLDETLVNLLKRGFIGEYWKGKEKKVSGVLVTLSSPWFASKTKHVNIVNENPFIITKQFLDNIANVEEETFKKELSKNNKNSLFSVIEKSIVHVKINGYTISDSLGKKTKIFDAYLSLSVVPEMIADKIKEIIVKNMHVQKEQILMHSFPLVSFAVIRDIFAGDSDFVIMDITGEITDLTLVKDGVILETVSFPSGRHHLIRETSKAFDISPEIAESLLHMYVSNKANESISEKMHDVFSKIEKQWSEGLEGALSEFKTVLPQKLYLTCDSDAAPIFMEFLKIPKEEYSALDRKNLSTIYINHEVLSRYYSSTAKVPDEFIGILSIFYNKLKNQKNG